MNAELIKEAAQEFKVTAILLAYLGYDNQPRRDKRMTVSEGQMALQKAIDQMAKASELLAKGLSA